MSMKLKLSLVTLVHGVWAGLLIAHGGTMGLIVGAIVLVTGIGIVTLDPTAIERKAVAAV